MLQKFPPGSMSEAMNLFQAVKGLTLDQITAQHVRQAALLIGSNPTTEQVGRVITLARAGDPKASLLTWAQSKLEDGTFAQLLNPPPKVILHRCDFCGQPNTVPLQD